ncbi:MAG: thioredoxin family protein [Verrucomicrobiales bacterium]|nr:thioredoxin family protein [Verrucomicrobiales bacterium]
MKFKLLLAAAVMTTASAFASGPGWSPDFAGSQKKAASEKKDLLVDFTGSDWCIWCKKLQSEVFSHAEFTEGVKDSFVLVELDYPRDKSHLSEETRKQNEELKDRYPIKGYPTILLVDPEGKPFAATGYQPDGPVKYVESLNKLRAKKTERDEALAKAAKAEGVEKAKQLVAALKALELDEDLVSTSYKEVVEQIKAADPADETGYTKKMTTAKRLADFNAKLGQIRQSQDKAKTTEFLDQTLAEKDLPVEIFQHAHGFKASFLLMDKNYDEAAKVLEAGLAAGPDTDIGKQLSNFLEFVKKEKEKAGAAPAEGEKKDEKTEEKKGDKPAEVKPAEEKKE